MLAFILAPFYIAVNIYLIWHILRWTGACHRFFASKGFRIGLSVVYAFAALSPLTSFLVRSPAWAHRLLMRINNYWIGWLLYLALAVVVVELLLAAIRLIRRQDFEKMQRMRRVQGAVALMLVCVGGVYGMLHVHDLHVKEYTVQSEKAGEDLTIALLADLHLGYSTRAEDITEAVEQVNKMHPDLIVIAGDIFDNEYEAIPEPENIIQTLAGLQSRYGTYACYGNHDLREPILAGFTWGTVDQDKDDPRMEEFLQKAKIRLLSDETVLIDDSFYLIGRKDPSRAHKTNDTRLSPVALTRDLDPEKTILMLDHEPKQLEEIADCGVDLDLSGHTHDGQMFPGNLLIGLGWENPYGLLYKGQMTSIVTSGIGVWGPAMRVGTDSEVVCIHLERAG